MQERVRLLGVALLAVLVRLLMTGSGFGLLVIAYLTLVAWLTALQGKPVSLGWIGLICLCIVVREFKRWGAVT